MIDDGNRVYIAIDLNNAESKVMPILLFKVQNIVNHPKNIGITNHIRP